MTDQWLRAAVGFLSDDQGKRHDWNDSEPVSGQIRNIRPGVAAIGGGAHDGSRWIGQFFPVAITRPEGSPPGRDQASIILN